MQRCCYKAILIDKGKDYIHIKLILWYIDSRVPARELIICHKKEGTEDVMRTIADIYQEEGEAKGIKEIATAIATRMLKQKLDLKLIASVTGLTSDEILKLKNSTQLNN